MFNSGYGVGGSAMHHYAVWPRLHEEDFGMKSHYGRGLDWPIRYDDLAPYYDRVQQECGVSRRRDAGNSGGRRAHAVPDAAGARDRAGQGYRAWLREARQESRRRCRSP